MADDLEAVSIARRAAAGAVDAAAVATLSVGLAVVPWVLGGFSMPMVGPLVAILGWHVAPLAAFGATAGMRLAGLRMAGLDSPRPDAIEVAFRELLGRGLLPVSYLVVVVVGVVSTLVGTGDFHAPGRVGLLLVLTSLVTGVGAALGHLLPLQRKDRRSLADLVGRTRVVRSGAAQAEPDDEDARRDEAAARRWRRKVFWGFEAGFAVLGLGVPLVLGRPMGAQASQVLAERLIRERSDKLFEANPADPDVALEVIDRLERSGDVAGSLRAREKHRLAAAGLERGRELKLREAIAKSPGDQASVDALVDLLLEQRRDGEARLALLAFVEAAGSPRERVRCGDWMRQHGFPADAVALLQRAVDEGETDPEPWGWLGLALRDLGRKDEARAALARALSEVAEWREVREALDELGGPPEAGPDAGRK